MECCYISAIHTRTRIEENIENDSSTHKENGNILLFYVIIYIQSVVTFEIWLLCVNILRMYLSRLHFPKMILCARACTQLRSCIFLIPFKSHKEW